MKKPLIFFITLTVFVLLPVYCYSHFGMVIPNTNIVSQDNKELSVQLSFSHPFENIGMELSKPEKFYVVHHDTTEDLLPLLSKNSVMGHTGWMAHHKPKRPGVYHYVMEPTPYWEEAEDLYIIHYTKTVVAAYGDDEDWDKPVGLPAEIVPQLRPFGNYAGNTFSGKVMLNGKPVPFGEVEVEFYNKNKTLHSPSDYHITQVVKTDENGIFTFSCPIPGWWGFSSLNEADYTLKGPNNAEKGVELGGVLWIYFDSIVEK